MLSRLILAAALLHASRSSATPENTLLDRYDTDILKFASMADTSSFKANDGTTLAYRNFRTTLEPKGTIVLLPGYTESYEKYAELGVDLTQAGYDLFVLDHRGMGRSERLTSNRQIVHVANFDDYIADTLQFVRDIVLPKQRGELYLLAHSTGGLIGANVLASSSLFKAAVFSAPLFEINLHLIPEWLAYLAVSFNILRGAAAEYVPGQHDFDPETFTHSESTTTTSVPRATLQRRQWLNNQEIAQSGPSNQWLREAIRGTWRREELASKISIPILIFSAEDDRYVKRGGQEAFCKRAKQCRIFEPGKGSRHELLMERDEIRDDILRQTLSHFAN